ncbi:hypothetical protein CEN44_07520 [Fischerella muscicola CCMEE 5323]|uniref:Uncharacterized protein n=2 Tax=Fischerella muscicola TaxID=92938 RepID=A0A2N6K5X2_FISMU|nr:hypothetical protein CEN44_07520 [Fischerella muscicola CCMEE 5323]
MVKNLLIMPGCYHHYLQTWQNILVDNIDSSQKILRSLYTDWGLAVAACVEGDIQRAIQIKPSNKTVTVVETFACKFVAYHEGCYQLQQYKWREAILPLNQAKSEIQASLNWQQEIDKLCTLQRQNISNFTEHLEFAQFWYDLLASQLARSYLAEYKAEQLREKLANETISSEKALRELQEIKKIDEYNPVVTDLIERVEVTQELKEIDRLLRNGQYETMVKRARLTHHERVRFIVANFFLEILIDGLKNGNLHDPKLIMQLGSWAYEICPNEPEFQAIYQSLRLR